MYVGMKVETLKSGVVTVIEVLNKDWCVVEFEDGFIKKTSRRGLSDRKIKKSLH